jgi:hypothetical protein
MSALIAYLWRGVRAAQPTAHPAENCKRPFEKLLDAGCGITFYFGGGRSKEHGKWQIR